MVYTIEQITDTYRNSVNKQIAQGWSGPFVVSKGILHDTRIQPGFIAKKNDEIIGYILYNFSDFPNRDCEITVLESLCKNIGVGSALINAVINAATDAKCNRVWLITTNDNIHAIRFYQRQNFTLKKVHINALEISRKLKPQIPLTGYDGLPIAHEFEFEKYIEQT